MTSEITQSILCYVALCNAFLLNSVNFCGAICNGTAIKVKIRNSTKLSFLIQAKNRLDYLLSFGNVALVCLLSNQDRTRESGRTRV